MVGESEDVGLVVKLSEGVADTCEISLRLPREEYLAAYLILSFCEHSSLRTYDTNKKNRGKYLVEVE
eukprot:g56932.t1